MKRKLTAFLTALFCAVSAIPVHSMADPGEPGIITKIAYDENGAPFKYLVDDEFCFYISAVKEYYDGPALECGDVVIVNCDNMEPVSPGICNFVEGNSIEYVGKAEDICEIVTVTVTKREGTKMYAQDASGTEYSFWIDYFHTVVYPGDVIEFAVMDGELTYATDASPLGDVNGDKSLDILDVILMNKCVMAGEPLPVLSNSRSSDLGQCDFNGNGILDADDSLGMMKRILRLEDKVS